MINLEEKGVVNGSIQRETLHPGICRLQRLAAERTSTPLAICGPPWIPWPKGFIYPETHAANEVEILVELGNSRPVNG